MLPAFNSSICVVICSLTHSNKRTNDNYPHFRVFRNQGSCLFSYQGLPISDSSPISLLQAPLHRPDGFLRRGCREWWSAMMSTYLNLLSPEGKKIAQCQSYKFSQCSVLYGRWSLSCCQTLVALLSDGRSPVTRWS